MTVRQTKAKTHPIFLRVRNEDKNTMKARLNKENYTQQLNKAIQDFHGKHIGLEKAEDFPIMKSGLKSTLSTRLSSNSKKIIEELLKKFKFSNQANIIALALQECL